MPSSLESPLTDGIMKGWGSTVVIWERAVTFAAGVQHRYHLPQSRFVPLRCHFLQRILGALPNFWATRGITFAGTVFFIYLFIFFCTQAVGHTREYAKHTPTHQAQAPVSFSVTVYSNEIYPSVWAKFNNTYNALAAARTVVSVH